MEYDTYEKLNAAVNRVFFDGRHQSSPVYLDLEDDVVLELSNALSCEPDDLDLEIGASVSETLQWDGTNIYSWHLGELLLWRLSSDDTAPPFSALLLALTLAAERMRQGEEFSSTNYYQRLAEVLGITDTTRIDKIKSAGKYTLRFWKSLNQWLMDNDYAYGRPTASQVNKWTYVSYALSQSLVRDADRKHLHRMFHDYGLSSHEKLSESEIRLYLNEWMAGNGPSSWLKKIWAVNDLRERVVTAAAHELETWEHSETTRDNTSSAAGRRLTWAAVIQKFPKLRIRLSLVTYAGSDRENEKLKIKHGSVELARKVLEDQDHFYLSSFTGTEMVQLEPIEKLNLNALMLASFELTNENKSSTYKHEARAAIPLTKQEGSPYFREVSRVTLFSDHLVLCHENWKGPVENYLSKHANPDFTITESMTGLPPQWVLFQKVELIEVPSEVIHDNLQCLVPLPEGANIHFTGGLKLAPSIWHSKAPPEVIASDDEGLLDVALMTDNFDGENTVLCKSETSSYNPGFLSSVLSQLDSKNLVVTAARGKSSKAAKAISFRSATTPRRLLPSKDIELVYSLCESQGRGWGLSATADKETNNGHVTLKGMVLSGKHVSSEDFDKLGEHAPIDMAGNEEDEWRAYKTQAVEGIEATCILRGYHVWRVADDSSCMTCNDCQAFQIVPPRKVRRRSGSKPGTTSTSLERRPQGHVSAIIRKSSDAVGPDVVYDAICYVGAGRWSGLQNLISPLAELPWEVSIIQKMLVDLGLVDVMMSIESLKPSHWCVTPPALIITPDEHAFLSGFRNDSVLGRVKEVLSDCGCTYQSVPQKNAPSVHLWSLGEADREVIEDKLMDITCPRGNPVEVVDCPAHTIISAMPSTSEMEKHLRPIHVEDNGDIERFDPHTGKWKSARMHDRGAYRTYFSGRKYFYRDGNGDSKEGDLGLVKLLAARDAGTRLHGYDQTSKSFECVIGCEPPGLYRRALVGCSGMLPSVGNGKVSYTGVPGPIAAQLMYKLYN